jgi:hypothetical protein
MGWTGFDQFPWDCGYAPCEILVEDADGEEPNPFYVTLANGQRIIVRALSEDRKAARAFNRRVKKAVDANQRPWLRGVE